MSENFSFTDGNEDGVKMITAQQIPTDNDGRIDATFSDSNYDGHWDTFQLNRYKDGYFWKL